jgi:hypothetical protein
LSPAISNVAAIAAKEAFEKSLGVSFPLDYDRFLAFSDGMGTQRGNLFGSADIQTWNNAHWNRVPTCRDTPDGAVIESFPDPDPRPIEYVWIGSHGNMDMYSFHLATRQYRVTNLSFDYIYGKFGTLEEFLLYLSDPKIELAGPA